MHLVCRTCSAPQSVVPERESNCASCGAPLTTRDVPLPRSGSQGWFIVGIDGQTGPFEAEQLARMFDRGELAWTDSVWRVGLRDWRPARKDDALVVAVANARGLDQATMRLDSVARLLGGAEAGDELADEDTHVDVIPAGLASSWPVRPGWPRGEPSQRGPWLARTLKLAAMALLAFVGGGLIVGVTGRLASLSAPKPAAAAPPLPQVAVAAMLPSAPIAQLARPSSGELVTRNLPALDEVRAELRRLGPSARRCVRDPKQGVELDVSIAGATGRPRQIDVRTPGLTPGMIECTKAALEDLQVAPFTASELSYSHHYAW